ncbi:type II secretion system F family protein [Patescibacteria group bacterium]|nr:type II secretion system F family protein [Patescibacteria group bacterium]
MPQFNYKAKNYQGEIFKGVVDAPNDEMAADVLLDKGLAVITLQGRGRLVLGKKGGFKLPWLDKVTKKDIVIFSRQLAVMISANLPVVQALKIIVKQTEKPILKKIVSDIADEVESGAKFSAALAKHNKAFSNFFISMIKSGETSGKLDEVLEYLADQEEKDYDLISRIKGAMIYPAFIISGLILVGTVMMIFVIPQLTGMLTASGATLPLSTRILIGVSNALKNYWWIFLLIIIGGAAGFKQLIKMPRGRRAFDILKLKFPLFGRLFKMIYLTRFTQSLSTLVRGGVPLTAGLKIVSEVVGNQLYQDLIDRTIKEVEDGNSVAVVFLESDIVPRLVSQMMAVGEKTGRLDDILDKVAAFYSREITNMVANLTSLIEPFIMVLIGVAVGGMVAAIILPMYNLANQF